jgi:hypothetical protein
MALAAAAITLGGAVAAVGMGVRARRSKRLSSSEARPDANRRDGFGW